MPSGLTKTQVCNLALDLIRASPLVNFDDPTSPEGRWVSRNFDHAAHTLMRAYPWNFAKEYRTIAADATAPAFKWGYSYSLPAGWARVLPISRYGARYGDVVPHEIVQNKVYTNEPAPLYVILIMDMSSNPGAWDDLFVEMMRCTLALGMANKFTGKSKHIELASQLLAQATAKAEEIDAFEGTPEPAEAFDIIRVRGGDEYTQTWRW
jgi:hypothetical protein